MCRLAETQHASSVPRAKLDLADLHVTVERLKGRKRVDGGKTSDQRGIRPKRPDGTHTRSHDSKTVLTTKCHSVQTE